MLKSFTQPGKLSLLVLAFSVSFSLNAQTTLGLGDIAFVSYESDGNDVWAFVLLEDIVATTEITFTDNGWFAAGGFRSGEGTLVWEATSDLSAGTIVVFTNDTPDIGSASGSGFALSTSGDQIFAYQGTAPADNDDPGFITAIQMNSDWDADATNTNTTALPPQLTDEVNCLSLTPERDNAYYDCASGVVGTAAALSDLINTEDEWVTSDDPLMNTPNACNFVIEAVMDMDGDGIEDSADNCPRRPNADQTDSDTDNIGDACDACINIPFDSQNDPDKDNLGDECDNCPNVKNKRQGDRDSDGVGNKCDNCIDIFNPDQMDSDGNGIGDACEGELIELDEYTDEEVIISANAFQLYPNPADELVVLNLTAFEGKAINILIFNQLGQGVWARNYEAVPGLIELDLSYFATGVYSVLVMDEVDSFSQKLTVK